MQHAWERLKMYLEEMGWEGVDWIHLAQDSDQWRLLVATVTERSGPIKGGEFLAK
jgi:hypothetical protein